MATSVLARRDEPATSGVLSEDELVRGHLPLVHYAVGEVASRVPRHVAREDLLSAAMLGLAQAARTFEETRGVAFDRFALIRIRGALLDELRGRDWASRSVRVMARRIDSAQDGLSVRLGRTPTAAETADEVGVDLDTLHRLAADVHRATVLNYESLMVDGDVDDLLGSADDGPHAILLSRERESYLHDAILALPQRLRRVVIGYFFEERPMQELAEELDVTESRISQMRAEALALLREGLDSQLDPDALPVEPRPTGRLARRKAAYYDAVGQASDYRTRLDAHRRPLAARAAERSA